MTTRAEPQALRSAVAGMLALASVMGIGRFIFTPILPDMSVGLGWSPTDAGLIASANYAGYLAGALAASGVRAGPALYRATRWMLVISALTTAASGVFDALLPLALVRFGGGVASAFVLILCSTIVLDRLAAVGRSGLGGLHFAGVGLGIALGGLLVAVLQALGVGWRGSWFVAGALSLVACIAVRLLLPGEMRRAPASSADAEVPGADAPVSPRQALAQLTLSTWRLGLSYGLFGVGYVILATFISTIVRDTPGLRWLDAPIWVVVGCAAIPSVMFWNAVAQRYGTGVAYASAAAMQAFGTALSLFETPGAMIIAAITLGGSMVALTAVGFAHARTLTTAPPHVVLGVLTAAFGLGQMLGPVLAGLVAEASGSFTPALIAASIALAVCAALTPRHPAGTVERRPGSDVRPRLR
ncbi:MAG: YbfB/YjiJ family MFS transporter [Pseudomonadota bacterium]